MEFSLSWLLVGLPAVFAMGWLASRLDARQFRLEQRSAPKAYFKGLNHLLNEQQDQAIDAFIEAVQRDPDTSELHFALGNLFRRRGDYDRAVRVHEHLLSRGDLSEADRHRAQYALALDYLKAGLLDRAEDALRRLEGTPYAPQARLALLGNFERSRDWVLADTVAQQLQESGQGDFSTRRAHYLCEQANAALAQDNAAAALQWLAQAIALAPHSARARLMRAQWLQRQGQPQEAMQDILQALRDAPQHTPLLAGPLAALALACNAQDAVIPALQTSYAQSPSLDVLEALVRLQAGKACAQARALYLNHLERQPSLVAAGRWLTQTEPDAAPLPAPVQRALSQATRALLRYRCAACGFEAAQHFWQCPGCQTWDSYPAQRVEEL
ncbi:MAG: lipopolysaccharide assembly protein LapB [Rhodoferax sp.]